MTVIQPGVDSEANSAAPGTVNPGSVCPACAATTTGNMDFNEECPTFEHSKGEQGYSCMTIEVVHEDGCPKPLNVAADD